MPLPAPEGARNIGKGYSKYFSAFYYPERESWTLEVAVVHGDDVSHTHVEGIKDLGQVAIHEADVAVVRFIRAMNMKMEDKKWTPEETWEHYFGEPFTPWYRERE